MTTVSTLIRALGFPVAIVTAASAPAKEPSDGTPFPHPVALEVTLSRSRFEVREPVSARVTLTNLGGEPFRLSVRDDGAPYGVGLHVFRADSSYTKHGLWLKRNGPEPREFELGGGESTGGDILVLLDFGKDYVFSDPGQYHIRWRWSPGVGFAKVYTDELRVTVVRSSQVNKDFLDQLELVAFRYHGGEAADTLDLSTPEAKKGLDREGLLLLGQIIRQNKPHLVDPERSPADKREAKLVEALTDLLDHQPDSSYSGYVARFLGLVHINTFEHVFSHGRLESWNRKNLSDEMQAVRNRASVARERALKYLTMASQHDLWPQTTSLYELGRLHVLSEEWDKVRQCADTLRESCGATNGAEIADELERKAARYRWKLERRLTTAD